MKIAVTSQNFRTVTGHAGRARRFLIFEAQPGGEPVETGRLDLPKELAIHDFDDDGPHPIDGVDAVLSEGFGQGFAQRMARRGIIAAATAETDPLAAVTAYLRQVEAGNVGLAAIPCTCSGEAHGHGHEHGHGHHHGHGHGHGHHHAQEAEPPSPRPGDAAVATAPPSGESGRGGAA